MSVPLDAISRLNTHWAVAAIGVENLTRAQRLADERLAQDALSGQITFGFQSTPAGDSLIESVAFAYEMAAVEGLDLLGRATDGEELPRESAVAASHCAFGFRRLLPVPLEARDRISHVLHLSALAYCGDRWSDLRRWYREHPQEIAPPSLDQPVWDQRLLFRLFDCWVALFRKNGWKDLDRVRIIIAGLREDQQAYESAQFADKPLAENRAAAFRLIALYHWAKASEVLATYMLQGQDRNVRAELEKHFEAAIKAAAASHDAPHEMMLRWLHAASQLMVRGSLWWATRTVNSRVTKFVKSLTSRDHSALFELLPPQRTALLEKGLLDQAKTAIVVDMPTSGGKTLLAQFRILQALNQFDADKGWVAYVAPTRALSAQITRRLRQDFEPIGVKVEQLTAAVEIDVFEEEMLQSNSKSFDVLVATPEKLSLVIRNKKVSRPLALLVMDEAHNIENESRGMRIELLLATVKRDCPYANFLLLMPFVEKAETIARWLAQDISAGQAISLGTTAWKPNERIVGLYKAVPDTEKDSWHLEFETLTATNKAMNLHGTHRAGESRPVDVSRKSVLSGTHQKANWLQTAAMASVMSKRGTSISMSQTVDHAWKMGRQLTSTFPTDAVSDNIRLVQDFLKTEISPNFELVTMLDKRVGVHHAGLSTETRALMEWLAEKGELRVLCATSTIAQGINFPVSSVFLASRHVHQGKKSVEMNPREFWNLVGRAGRIDHDAVGVVGLAQGKNRDAIIDFVSRQTGELASRLVTIIEDLKKGGKALDLSGLEWKDEWEDFRCYIAHLWAEKKNLDAVLAESEQLLRQTFGYSTLRNNPATKADADQLLAKTRDYARKLASTPGLMALADSTGFSPEGVKNAMTGLSQLEDRMTPGDWSPEGLFGEGGKIASLFGVMLKVRQLKSLEDIAGSRGNKNTLAEITKAWVNGESLEKIAKEHFADGKSDETHALTIATRAIYKDLVNSGTWGISALSRFSDLDFDKISAAEKRRINAVPAMVYHGVRTEDAVLMRMNEAPRSAAEKLGGLYCEANGANDDRLSISKSREFLKGLDASDWSKVRPKDAALSGAGYLKIWGVLSGEMR